jgi:hypothetical protein
MCKMMKQHPDMLDMLKIYCDKWKQKKNEFQKLTQNRPVYDELCTNLEPSKWCPIELQLDIVRFQPK